MTFDIGVGALPPPLLVSPAPEVVVVEESIELTGKISRLIKNCRFRVFIGRRTLKRRIRNPRKVEREREREGTFEGEEKRGVQKKGFNF